MHTRNPTGSFTRGGGLSCHRISRRRSLAGLSAREPPCSYGRRGTETKLPKGAPSPARRGGRAPCDLTGLRRSRDKVGKSGDVGSDKHGGQLRARVTALAKNVSELTGVRCGRQAMVQAALQDSFEALGDIRGGDDARPMYATVLQPVAD